MKRIKLIIIAIIITFVANAQSPIFEENFDTLSYGDPPPADWSIYYMADFTGSNQWKATGFGYNGTFAINHQSYYSTSQSADNWVVSPQIAIGANAILSFKDWTKPYNTGSTFGHSSVLISTGSALPSDSDFVEVMVFDTTVLETWKTNIIDLASYSGNNIYLAFKYEAQALQHRWTIDDVVVESSYIDGGISNIVSPSGVFYPGGLENVTVNLKNYGNQAIDTATINWSVNGIVQTPYFAVGINLIIDDSLDIIIGQYDFTPSGVYTLEATSDIGGDTITTNNTATGTYTIMATIDIGVVDISPKDGFPVSGNVNVKATVKNFGTAVANDFNINWYVDSIAQTVFSATNMNLQPGESVKLNVGTYNFTAGNYTISAVSNNLTDIDNSNDSTSVDAIIGYLWESFEAVSFPPTGWSCTYATRDLTFGAYHGNYFYSSESAVNMFGTISDTLFTPLLEITSGDSLSFALRLNDWFPVNYKIVWKDGFTGLVSDIQTIQSPGVPWTTHTINISLAEGINYIGFVSTTTGISGPTNLDYITSSAIYHNYDYDLSVKKYKAEPVARTNIPEPIICTVKNTGKNTVLSSDYSIKLIEAPNIVLATFSGVDINPWDEAEIEILHSFTTVADNKLTLKIDYTADLNQADNTTDTFLIFSVPATAIDDEIGQPNIVNLNFPFDASGSTMSMGEDDICQTLYLNNEVDAGYIHGFQIMYYSIFHGKRILPLKVWIAETSLMNMSGDWIPYSDFVLVFDGEIEIGTDTTMFYVPFNTPYLYTGINNLVVQSYQYDPEWPSLATRIFANGSAPQVRTHSMINVFNLDPTNPGMGGNYFNDYPYTIFVTDTLTDIGIISGNVYNTLGISLPNSMVEVVGTVVSAQTDITGTYELPSIPFGTYDIIASAFGYEDNIQNIVLNQPNLSLNFVLFDKALIEISGYVEGSNSPGTPLSEVEISLSGYAPFSTTSNSSGNFSISQVYGNENYTLTLSKFGYFPHSISLSAQNIPIDVDTIILQEKFIPAFDVNASPLGDDVLVSWTTPAMASEEQIKIDYDTISYSYTNEPYEEVWLGNKFLNYAEITLTDIEIVFDIYPLDHDSVTIDIFDENQVLLVSSLTFVTAYDTAMTIDIPNITLTGSFYAMLHWQNNELNTDALAIDYSAGISNVAYIKYPGDDILLFTDVIGGWDGAFLIRANILDETTLKPCNVLGYNVYRGLFEDYSNMNNWSILNSAIVTNEEYTDDSWIQLPEDGNYVFAIEAIYTEGNAEVTFSNTIYGMVDVPEIENDNIEIFPNPVSELLSIQNVENSKIDIYDIVGNLLYSDIFKTKSAEINMKKLSCGVYFIHIIKGNNKIIKKIQKIN